MTRQIYAVGTIAGYSLYVAYLTGKLYTGCIQYDNVQERKIGNFVKNIHFTGFILFLSIRF